jgi:hypothetical protein
MIDSTLYIRSHTATINALYDARQVQFKYVNSTNLDYGLVRCFPKSHVGPTSNLVKRGNCDVGGREIHRNYNRG